MGCDQDREKNGSSSQRRWSVVVRNRRGCVVLVVTVSATGRNVCWIRHRPQALGTLVPRAVPWTLTVEGMVSATTAKQWSGWKLWQSD